MYIKKKIVEEKPVLPKPPLAKKDPVAKKPLNFFPHRKFDSRKRFVSRRKYGREKKKPIKTILYRFKKGRKKIRKRIFIYKHNLPYLFKKRIRKLILLKKYAEKRRQIIQTSIFLKPPSFKEIRYPFKLNLKLVKEYITNY